VSAARPSLTPTLLRDLLRIAPRSSVLQEALALNARARNTLTHKGSFAKQKHGRGQSKASVDWTAYSLQDFARGIEHGEEGGGLGASESAASLGLLHIGDSIAHAPLGKRLGHSGSAAALQAAHRDLLEFTEAGSGGGGGGGPGGGDADGYGDDPRPLHSSSSFALLKLAMAQDAHGSSGSRPSESHRGAKRAAPAAATAALTRPPPVPASLLSLSSLMSAPLTDSDPDEQAAATARESAAAAPRVPLHHVRVDLDGAEPIPTPGPIAPPLPRGVGRRKQKQQTRASADPSSSFTPLLPAVSAADFALIASSPLRCGGPLLLPLRPVVRQSLGAEHLPPPASKPLHPRAGKGYQARVRYA